MFRLLRTRLAVLYAGLFAFVLAAVTVAVSSAIISNVNKSVRADLSASSGVFDRIWSMRVDQLREIGTILSRDFGFRQAVATGDDETVASALDNLAARLEIDLALIIHSDGRIASPGAVLSAEDRRILLGAFERETEPSGVLTLDGTAYQAISVPILAPDPVGWLVFGSRLDSQEMNLLERLSSVPIEAAIATSQPQRHWRLSHPIELGADLHDASALAAEIVKEASAAPREFTTDSGAIMALAKPLPAFGDAPDAALVLNYPIDRAFSPYRPLQITIALLAIIGMIAVILGSWALARRLTLPISALAEAAGQLQEGEDVRVDVNTEDEVGRLANGFNQMAAEIRKRQREITRIAFCDRDTDLPNRLALEQQAARHMRNVGTGVVAFVTLGIDRFHYIRGTLGYTLSVSLLREIASRLDKVMPNCPLARLSTDTIGVVVPAADDAAAAAQTAALLAALDAPIKLDGLSIDVNASAGYALYPKDGDGAHSLVEHANIALDQARKSGSKIATFDREAYEATARNLSLMSEMLDAMSDGSLTVNYQPKTDLRSGQVRAVEALVRWSHPRRGMVPPDQFVPMAEETGHIGTLTEWVIARAIVDQTAMLEAGHDVTIAVNISGRLLSDGDFADHALESVAAAPGKFCFEITETAVIAHPDRALEIIDRFSRAGIEIAIDDYGSGLSSLAYLKQINAHELKIDKAFVLAIAESVKDTMLVRSTVELAHSLGMKVTAEGVETAVAYSLLAGMGCDFAQGFLIGRAMSLHKLLGFLAQTPAVPKVDRMSGNDRERA